MPQFAQFAACHLVADPRLQISPGYTLRGCLEQIDAIRYGTPADKDGQNKRKYDKGRQHADIVKKLPIRLGYGFLDRDASPYVHVGCLFTGQAQLAVGDNPSVTVGAHEFVDVTVRSCFHLLQIRRQDWLAHIPARFATPADNGTLVVDKDVIGVFRQLGTFQG